MDNLHESDLDEILGIEQRCYSHPWSRGHFLDSLQSGHLAQGLRSPNHTLMAYTIAMTVIDELQILNFTVAPDFQRQGLGYTLLGHLAQACHARGLTSMWLEVRVSNLAARSLYQKFGFTQVGTRTRYYPSHHGQREDAALMRLELNSLPTH